MDNLNIFRRCWVPISKEGTVTTEKFLSCVPKVHTSDEGKTDEASLGRKDHTGISGTSYIQISFITGNDVNEMSVSSIQQVFT